MVNFLKRVLRFWLAILLVAGLALVYLFPLWFALYVAFTVTPEVREDRNLKGELYEHRINPA